ncbi:hypothetical protein L6R49_16670 [Myxococcota bacterium]|nr:hypothetical protein [Myxococcota bacterium]
MNLIDPDVYPDRDVEALTDDALRFTRSPTANRRASVVIEGALAALRGACRAASRQLHEAERRHERANDTMILAEETLSRLISLASDRPRPLREALDDDLIVARRVHHSLRRDGDDERCRALRAAIDEVNTARLDEADAHYRRLAALLARAERRRQLEQRVRRVERGLTRSLGAIEARRALRLPPPPVEG